MIVPKPQKMTSGNYYIRLRLGGQAYNVVESTAKKCIHEAERIKADYLSGKRMPQKQEPLTLTRAIDKYIEQRQGVLSPLSVRSYRIIQRNRFPALMLMDVNKITKDIAQKAVSDAASQYAAKTVLSSWRFISTVIEDSTGNKLKVRLPQLIRRERNFLQPEDVPVFCAAVRGTAVEVPCLLALCSLRQSEILALRWQDVDLDHGIVHVDGAVVPDEHNKFVRKEETKTVDSRRWVPIMPDLAELLKSESGRHAPSDPVVTLSASWIYKKLSALCDSHGLPHLSLHSLRHSFASIMYHNGASEKVTAKIGGWRDASTLHNIYTHIADVDERKAAMDFVDFFPRNEIVK